jgi:hypothetical protein
MSTDEDHPALPAHVGEMTRCRVSRRPEEWTLTNHNLRQIQRHGRDLLRI